MIDSLYVLRETLDEGASINLRINLHTLIKVTEIKYLQLFIDENLTFKNMQNI